MKILPTSHKDTGMNILAKLRDSKRAFKIGIFLLITNPPLGYLGFIVGGSLSTMYQDKAYLTVATLFYAFTWVMAGAGIILADLVGLFHTYLLYNHE